MPLVFLPRSVYYNSRDRETVSETLQKKERDEIMMKGFFNDLVAARMLDLDQNRVKSMSRKAHHNAK